jgi:hypothetical protein
LIVATTRLASFCYSRKTLKTISVKASLGDRGVMKSEEAVIGGREKTPQKNHFYGVILSFRRFN